MASLYEDNGKIFLSYYDPAKGRIRQSLKLNSKDKSAWSKARAIRDGVQSRLKEDPFTFSQHVKNNRTVRQVLDEFLEKEGSMRSKSTRYLYKLSVGKLEEFLGSTIIDSISTDDLIMLRKSLELKYGKSNSGFFTRHLRALFKWAANRGYVQQYRYTSEAVSKSPEEPVEIFHEEDIKKLFSYPNINFVDQVKFLLFTGFRLVESCDLTWDRVDIDRRVIKHYNQKKSRWSNYPIDERLHELLTRLQKSKRGDYVFHYRSKHSMDKLMLDAKDKLKLRDGLVIHSLKATYVSSLIKNKELSLSEVHFLSHHTNPATTLKFYAWFDVDSIRKKIDLGNSLEKKTVFRQ